MYQDANFVRNTLVSLGLFGCLALASLGTATSAQAGADVKVPVDQARIVELAGDPGTVIVGNPTIADVTLRNGNLMIIQGKAYGETNIIVLSPDGEQIANMDVIVQTRNKNALSIYSSAGRRSFRCHPFCEGEVNTGDNKAFFEQIAEQNVGKIKAAKKSGSTSSGGGGGGGEQ
ncbi:MAG: hypothetical protein GY948_25785 [Alphaproteobacteria bacterium]|nr:hypothetical protein [Alphaproteobacteria bacterium]